MIDRKDFVAGRVFWYSNFKLTSKFEIFGDINNYFSKVKVVLSGPFLKLQKICNEKDYSDQDYIVYSQYMFCNVKDTYLSRLFYTEQEAIEDWNNKVETYRTKLNKFFDQKISYSEENFSDFIKFKNCIKKFKENIENLNKTDLLIIDCDNITKEKIFYRLNYNFYKPTKKENFFQYSSYFSFDFLKLRVERDKDYVFDIYNTNYNQFSMDDVIDYCAVNRSIYSTSFYKSSNLKNQMINNGICTGISNLQLITLENKYYNFINEIRESYNNMDNYLISLKK